MRLSGRPPICSSSSWHLWNWQILVECLHHCLPMTKVGRHFMVLLTALLLGCLLDFLFVDRPAYLERWTLAGTFACRAILRRWRWTFPCWTALLFRTGEAEGTKVAVHQTLWLLSLFVSSYAVRPGLFCPLLLAWSSRAGAVSCELDVLSSQFSTCRLYVSAVQIMGFRS